MSKYIKRFEKNKIGNDYFVGDLHGCYDLLMAKLDEIGFDKTKDRLFSVGDLGDRGPDSYKCILLLNEPWFHAVRGNHEDMVIGVYRGGWPTDNFVANGGRWFFYLHEVEQESVIKLVDALPFVIEIEDDDGLIGVVHAEHFGEWSRLHQQGEQVVNNMEILWGRQRINKNNCAIVPGVKALVVGHTPLEHVEVLGNTVYIDTGACFSGGHLTILSLHQVKEFVNEAARN